jgi:hypothetical protein
LSSEVDSQNGGSWPTLYDTAPPARPEIDYADVIDRGVLDVETARKAFDRYTQDIAPIAPFVVFPPSTSMAEIRRTKPILFLSILSVAVPVFLPSLQLPLINEVHRIFADRVLVRGLKSLELVQSLLVATLWYVPPDHLDQLKFYQFVHLAAAIGVELGMNRRSDPRYRAGGLWREIVSKRFPHVSPESVEARRAWMGCYFMALVYVQINGYPPFSVSVNGLTLSF